jgi:hypothetical protein
LTVGVKPEAPCYGQCERADPLSIIDALLIADAVDEAGKDLGDEPTNVRSYSLANLQHQGGAARVGPAPESSVTGTLTFLIAVCQQEALEGGDLLIGESLQIEASHMGEAMVSTPATSCSRTAAFSETARSYADGPRCGGGNGKSGCQSERLRSPTVVRPVSIRPR